MSKARIPAGFKKLGVSALARRNVSARPGQSRQLFGLSLRQSARRIREVPDQCAGQRALSVVPCDTLYNMAVRERLYPSGAEDIATLDMHCAHARFVWNLAVEQQSWWRPGRGHAPGHYERKRQLTDARAAEPWLREGSSSVQQQALHDFDHAMTAFFDPENPAGKPVFCGQLPRRIRLRLRVHRIVDDVAYWLVCHGHCDAARHLWQLCGMW